MTTTKPTKQLELGDLLVSPVVFIEQEHEYFCGIDKLTGVTTMLSAVFGDNYAGIDADVLRNAADRGTATHLAIQAYECEGRFSADALQGTPYEAHLASAKANLQAWKKERANKLPRWHTLGAEYLISNEIDIASMIDLVMQDADDKSIYLADMS